MVFILVFRISFGYLFISRCFYVNVTLIIDYFFLYFFISFKPCCVVCSIGCFITHLSWVNCYRCSTAWDLALLDSWFSLSIVHTHLITVVVVLLDSFMANLVWRHFLIVTNSRCTVGYQDLSLNVYAEILVAWVLWIGLLIICIVLFIIIFFFWRLVYLYSIVFVNGCLFLIIFHISCLSFHLWVVFYII